MPYGNLLWTAILLVYRKVALGNKGQDRFKYLPHSLIAAYSSEWPVWGITLAFEDARLFF
jgi:hypothetical protein